MKARGGGLHGVVLALVLGWLAMGSAQAQQSLATFERDSLVLRMAEGAEQAFDIELAVSPQQQAQGLMFRRSLAADAGMLTGNDIIAIGGSGGGADTALVVKPAHQNNFFDLRIREIICKPREF